MMINGRNNYNGDFSEKMHDYIHALEDERRKVQVFQRELPLTLELITHAMETCRQQLSGTTTEQNLHGQSECSEQICSPVFEDFFSVKRVLSHSDDEEQEPSKKAKNNGTISSDCNDDDDERINIEKNSKKSDWLRSVQLWNQTSDPPSKEDSPGKSAGASSTAETGCNGGGNKKEEKEGQSQRKARRCWSPELHKRFLQALQQLGGSHGATPKQIRELMKVDGLTNDEVKSHLQKYRLHTRKPNPSIHNDDNTNNNTQTSQFVVVGGMWVPVPEYVTMAATNKSVAASGGAASKGIYAPVATLPPPSREISSPKQGQYKQSSPFDGESGDQSYSPANSSSTHKKNV